MVSCYAGWLLQTTRLLAHGLAETPTLGEPLLANPSNLWISSLQRDINTPHEASPQQRPPKYGPIKEETLQSTVNPRNLQPSISLHRQQKCCRDISSNCLDRRNYVCPMKAMLSYILMPHHLPLPCPRLSAMYTLLSRSCTHTRICVSAGTRALANFPSSSSSSSLPSYSRRAPPNSPYASPPSPSRLSIIGLLHLSPRFPNLFIPPLLKGLLLLNLLQAPLRRRFLDDFLFSLLLGENIGHRELQGRLHWRGGVAG